MINCIAIDDEPPALEVIRKFCSQVDFIELLKTFTKPSEADLFMRKFPVDLMFLDVQMPDISGIQFYKSLPMKKMVIFTTAHSEYAIEGFDLNALDYLVKPVKFERFMQAVNKTRDYFDYISQGNSADVQYLFVRSEYRLVKILLSDILYIKGLDDYIRIYTDNSRPIISHINLKSIAEKLPSNKFIRVHRSYIMPINRLRTIRNKQIQLGDIRIPIGISYSAEVLKLFSRQQ